MHDERQLLRPRLVPRPLWGHSACRLLAAHGRQEEWRYLRSIVLAHAENRCEPCGHRQRSWMVCDEVWLYRVEDRVAELVDLRVLCPACNAVCHLGHTGAAYGKDAHDRAVRHMARVNGTSIGEALALIEQDWERWRRLSSISDWMVRVEPQLASRFAALGIVAAGPRREIARPIA